MTAARILDLARAQGVTIATAESCTGGKVITALTDVPGASDVVERGFVTYSNKSKIDLLGVLPETLETFGAVSEPVAREMADGALRNAPVSLTVSVTGIAGPGGSEHKPEGRVCFGLAMSGCETKVETVEFGALGRTTVRDKARDHALHLLLEAVSPDAQKLGKS